MNSQVLDYSSHGESRFWKWLRRHRRLLGTAAGVVLLLAIVGYANRQWLGDVWGQWRHLRLQDRISHQFLPAGTVIFTEDPARIATVSSMAGYRQKADFDGKPYAAGVLLPWERVYAWADFPARDPMTGSIDGVQLDDTFGYLRTSAGGKAWIVHLDQVNPFLSASGKRRAAFTQGSVTPVGWTPGSRGIWVSTMSLQIELEPADRLTFFAPQPDPSDAARILVPYEINGVAGVLYGVVQDTGHVVFSVHSGPARLVKWNDP